MDDHFRHHHSHSLPLSLFSADSKSSIKEEMMQSGGSSRSYFSTVQWQELELQALIFKHMLTGAPIPPQLLHLLLNINSNTSLSFNYPCYPRSNFPPLAGGGYWGRGGMDPEPGRCKRTDGKKWRCSRDVVAGHKYCERHIHRGRNRSRKPVEVTTPTATTTVGNSGVTSTITTGAGVKPYATVAGGGSGHCAFFDQIHVNQRVQESGHGYGSSHGESAHETKPSSSSGRVLRPFFDDWPRTVEEQEMLATSLSISVPGDPPSDFSLSLSTGTDDHRGQRGEEVNGERERGPLSWGMLWGTNHAGSMGGPLAEALRSSSVSNSSSPTSVLHQLQRGPSSTTASETSYVST